MAFYPPPKLHPEFNPIDFKDKDDGTGDALEIAPPLIDEGVTYFKADGKLHTKNTLIFDEANNRLGIGTDNPTAQLHVQGNSFLSSNVGIGVASPTLKLEVAGKTKIDNGGIDTVTPALQVSGGNTYIDGNLGIGISNPTQNLHVAGNSYLVGNVGIGVSNPTTKLQIDGKSQSNYVDITTNSTRPITFVDSTATISTDYPLCIQSTNTSGENGNVTCAIAFSPISGSNVTSPGCALAYQRNGTNGVGQLDIRLKNATANRSALPSVMTFKSSDITSSVNTIFNAPVQIADTITFNNVSQKKIQLHTGATPNTTMYGFGVAGSALNYQVDNNASHDFRYGGTNDNGTLAMSIRSNGKMALGGNTQTLGRLSFSNTLEEKITLVSSDGASHHGFGVSTSNATGTNRENLNVHLQNLESELVYYSKGSNGANVTGTKQLARMYYSSYYNRPQFYIGQGASREYQLELEADSAFKGGSTMWSIGSDERIKENIILADLDRCYNDVKSLTLKRFNYKKGVFGSEPRDTNILGFIAQEVKELYPKAVSQKKMCGLEDCYDLDMDQIYRSLYGAVQKLIQKVETLEADNVLLKSEIAQLKNTNVS